MVSQGRQGELSNIIYVAHHVQFLLDTRIIIGPYVATLQVECVHMFQLGLLHFTAIDELRMLPLRNAHTIQIETIFRDT